jgi:hypothetical protein
MLLEELMAACQPPDAMAFPANYFTIGAICRDGHLGISALATENLSDESGWRKYNPFHAIADFANR